MLGLPGASCFQFTRQLASQLRASGLCKNKRVLSSACKTNRGVILLHCERL